jgi:GntR family transcriptional regulator/MocR family aminotransferase
MVLPKRLAEVFEQKLGFYSCTVPTFEQLLLARLISSGDFERHVNRVRRKKRRELSHSFEEK